MEESKKNHSQHPHHLTSLISLSGEEISEAAAVSFKEAGVSESGSKFIVRAAKVDSLETSRKLYTALLLNPSNVSVSRNRPAN